MWGSALPNAAHSAPNVAAQIAPDYIMPPTSDEQFSGLWETGCPALLALHC